MSFYELSDEMRASLQSWIMTQINNIDQALASHRAKWDKYIKLYKAQPEVEVKEFPWLGASNVVLPEIANSVEAAEAFIMANTVEQDPMFMVRPYKRDQVDAAEYLGELANFYTKVIQGAEGFWRDHLQYHLLLGTTVVKLVYSPSTAWPVVSLHAVPLNRIYNYPAITTVEDSPFFADANYVPISEIQGWYDSLPVEAGFTEGVMNTLYAANTSQLGITDRTSDERLEAFAIPPGYAIILDCYISWSGDPRYPVGLRVPFDLTSQQVLWAELCEPKDRPYVSMHVKRDPDSFFGVGFGDVLWTLQKGLTTAMNQAIDNATVANTRAWATTHDANLADNEAMYPGRIVRMSDPTKLQGLRMGDIYPSTYNNFMNLRAAYDRSAGIGPNTLGLDSDVTRSRQTAFGQGLNVQESAKRLNLRSWGFEQGVVEILWKTLEILSKYQEDYVYNKQVYNNPLGSMEEEEEILSLAEIMREAGTEGTLRSLIEARLDSDEATEVQQKVFALKELIANKALFRITASRRTENRQLERQAAMVISQLVSQYVQKIIGFASQITALRQQNAPQSLIATFVEAWKVTNVAMKKVLMKFPIENAADILITLTEVEHEIQQPGAIPGGGAAPGVGEVPAGAGEGNVGMPQLGGVSGIEGAAFGGLRAFDQIPNPPGAPPGGTGER